MSDKIKLQIMEAISHCPSDKIDEYFTYIQQKMQSNTRNRINPFMVISSFAGAYKIVNKQRDAFAVDLYEIIAAIPVQERESVVRNVALLQNPNMQVSCIINLIEAVKIIAAEERDDLVSHVLRICYPAITEMVISSLIAVLRLVPIDQRADIINHAQRLFTHEMSDHVKVMIIKHLKELPLEQRHLFVAGPLDFMRTLVQELCAPLLRGLPTEINVHAANRDQKVAAAIHSLRQLQPNVSTPLIQQAVINFKKYLTDSNILPYYKQLAQHALTGPKGLETYGPILDNQSFMIGSSVKVTGQEIIARLWLFASQLTEPEQTNAKNSMIFALKDSCDSSGSRVCHQGKTQRLILAVLQGRLAGVNIDEIEQMHISTKDAVAIFFNNINNRQLTNLASLQNAAAIFCSENSFVDKDAFLQEIVNYAQLQEIS